MAQVMTLELLGGFRVLLDATPVDGFVSSKARALLAYLAVTHKPQPRQVLAELFWGEKPDAGANSNLRMALSNLRALVGPFLRITRNEVGVNPDEHIKLDVEAFQSRLGHLSGNWTEHQLQAMEEAVALYQGDFLEGFLVRDAQSFDEWAVWQRERLRQMALQALQHLSSHHTERGNYAEALRFATRLLQIEPWQEDGHRQMMLLLALTGNRSAALAQYETCRRILAEELSVDPMPETNALHERIKAMPLGSGKAPTQANGRYPLFGRQEEHAWLLQEWKAVQGRQGRVSLIEGEMGIGKTRLVEDVLNYVAASQALILRARCHEFGNTLSYQAILDLLRTALSKRPDVVKRLAPVWLAQLATFLPELRDQLDPHLNALPLLDNGMARQHLFEAVYQFLKALIAPTAQTPAAAKATLAGRQATPEERLAPVGGQERLVIFLDDLHWIDSDTVDLLRYVAYRVHEHPMWLVGAYQNEGLAAEHPFLKLRRSLMTEDHAHVLRLTRLPVAAIVDWVATLPGLDDSQVQPLAELIVQRAEGNPFVTSQILRDLRESASVEQTRNGWRLQPGWPTQVARIPFAVREIVLLKLGRLNPGCLELFSTAAVLGESFDLTALQQMSSGTEDIQTCVFDWLEHGLVTMVQPGVYKFSHSMYREVAAEWLSPWHRLRAGNRPLRGEQAATGNVVRLPAARAASA